MLEHRAGIRKGRDFGTLRCGYGNFDVATRLKSILIRRDLYVHLKSVFKEFNGLITEFMEETYYGQMNVSPDGSFIKTDPDQDLDEGGSEAGSDKEGVETCNVSTFVTFGPLKNLLTRLARNTFEVAMCKLAKESVPGKALTLTCLKDDVLGKAIQDCRAKYETDFPKVAVAEVEPARELHSGLEVINKLSIGSEEEYKEELAQFNLKATKHEDDAVRDFVFSRVEIVVNPLDDTLIPKLRRVKMMEERKRKLYFYSVAGDGAINWEAAKKRRLNPYAGTGPGISESRVSAVVRRCPTYLFERSDGHTSDSKD